MRLKLITLTALFITVISIAQETTKPEDTSLSGQFDKIYRTSTTYQTYKVISKDKFLQLKQNVLDSLKNSKELVIEKNGLLNTERENTKKTLETLNDTKNKLATAIKKEGSISLLGVQVSKTTYNLILWTIILVLLLSLAYFIFKYTRNNILTKKAKSDLIEVESEYEKHRKKSIEREQKLRRELQDEINKQRNS